MTISVDRVNYGTPLTHNDAERAAYMRNDQATLQILHKIDEAVEDATGDLYTQEDLDEAKEDGRAEGIAEAEEFDIEAHKEELASAREGANVFRKALQDVHDQLGASGALDRKGLEKWLRAFLGAHPKFRE
jgi:hypothetical protein